MVKTMIFYLLKIEKKIGEIREKYRSSPTKVNTSKEARELEELFCKAFGFECCQFTVDMSSLHNACTLPISIADFGKTDRLVQSSASGLKFKKEAKAYVFITVTKGLFFSSEYTDGEVMAIIMHEVGHNFQHVLSPSSRTIRNVNNVLLWVFNPISMTMYGPLRDKYSHIIGKIREDSPGMVNAWYTMKSIVGTITGVGYTILRIMSNFSMLMNPLASFAQLPEALLRNMIGSLVSFLPLKYKDESISDAFSSAYGYGPELSTAFEKMKRNSNGMVADQIYRDSIVGAYFDLCLIPNKIIADIVDPHPNTVARIYSQYELLEKELMNGSLNPRMKAQIKDDMKSIKQTLEAYVDLEDQGYLFSNAIDKALIDYCKGDIRNGFANRVGSEFDSVDKSLR